MILSVSKAMYTLVDINILVNTNTSVNTNKEYMAKGVRLRDLGFKKQASPLSLTEYCRTWRSLR